MCRDRAELHDAFRLATLLVVLTPLCSRKAATDAKIFTTDWFEFS